VRKSARAKRSQLQNSNCLSGRGLGNVQVNNEPKSKPVTRGITKRNPVSALCRSLLANQSAIDIRQSFGPFLPLSLRAGACPGAPGCLRPSAPRNEKRISPKRCHSPRFRPQERGFCPFTMASFGFALASIATSEPIDPCSCALRCPGLRAAAAATESRLPLQPPAW